MPETKLQQLATLGQSLWLDYINREMLTSGKLQLWIDHGLRGLTSNPSIFDQVIAQSSDYDDKILQLKEAGKTAFEIYDELTIADIRDAADLFLPVYRSTKYADGYVSLEINPEMAHDADSSIREGRRLYQKVGRPNLMIKVPATTAGFAVVEELLAEGINVNVTLIFSTEQYVETVQAYIRGIRRLAAAGGALLQTRSVASVFVSRIDSLIDKLLIEQMKNHPRNDENSKRETLLGRAAVANCKLILELYRELFLGENFQLLMGKGAAMQRVLWGSTSTKNPQYSDIKYVQDLIAEGTVNTLPEATLQAFLDHGQVKLSLAGTTKEAEDILSSLNKTGIKIDVACRQLLDEGVLAFCKAFANLLRTINEKSARLCHQ
jgi:transaldolase